MRFNQAGDYITPARFFGAGGGEHGIGLPNAWGCAEKYLQMPPAFPLGEGKQGVRRGSLRLIGRHAAFLAHHTAKNPARICIGTGYRAETFRRLRFQGIQSEVEVEHVDPRLAQQPERATLDLAFNQGADTRFG